MMTPDSQEDGAGEARRSTYPKTVVRYGKSVRHAAYPVMGGQEYQTACGWRWKSYEVGLDSAKPECKNCLRWLS